jgi:hypothetical protein
MTQMTHCGHKAARNPAAQQSPAECAILSVGSTEGGSTPASIESGPDETAQVHHAARRRGGVAARGARAAAEGVALVGLLSGTQLDDQRFEAVRQGLKEVGYIVRELVPSATVVGLLVNPANPTSESQTRDAQTAALALGLRLPIQSASSEAAIDAAFASFAQQRVNAVMVGTDAFFGTRHDQLVGLTARHAMPAIYYLREAVAAGGLMSCGTSAPMGFASPLPTPGGF